MVGKGVGSRARLHRIQSQLCYTHSLNPGARSLTFLCLRFRFLICGDSKETYFTLVLWGTERANRCQMLRAVPGTHYTRL